MPDCDVIIVGSGIAALTAAYQLSTEMNVIIITKSKKTASNSLLAQGGVAACIGDDDTWHSHYNDTLIAGSGHNREVTVKMLVQKGPSYLLNLIKDGMKFDMHPNGNLVLGKEGAHTARRILHAGGDATGKALVLHMLDKIKNRTAIIEDEMAIDLIMTNSRCVGVKTKTNHDTVKNYFGKHIILATGGFGGLYSFTSNDASITGDGLAMAYRAGAELTDLEFIQFHPTLLNSNGKGAGLISEAVRGEGAKLIDENGKSFMETVHPLADLAPRDVVARTVFHEMLKGKKVYLDISMINDFETRFPTITAICKDNEIHIEAGVIPVIPGAHFSMGGIKTDHRGRTSIKGLYALGEVACTGVHGANRLASNSLLEGIVYGNLAADDINTSDAVSPILSAEEGTKGLPAINLPEKEQIQQIMMEHVGIVRNKERLQFAVEWFENYKSAFDGCDLSTVNKEQLTRINMITAGWLIATSALMRTESRGAHYRSDFPDKNDFDWYKKDLMRVRDREKILHPI